MRNIKALYSEQAIEDFLSTVASQKADVAASAAARVLLASISRDISPRPTSSDCPGQTTIAEALNAR